MSYINTINNTLNNLDTRPSKSAAPAISSMNLVADSSQEQLVQPVVKNEGGQQQKPDQHTDEQLLKAMESLKVDYGVKVELVPDDNGRIFVRIMSSDGERVLRQMPPDALIKIHASLKSNRGLLADWLV